MEESTLWTWSGLAGLPILGGAAGTAVLLAPSALVATDESARALLGTAFFVAVFLACGFALQTFRLGQRHAPLVGATSGGLAIYAFFATPLGVDALRGNLLDAGAVLPLLLVVPLLAAFTSGAGTLYLTKGVARYREKHGLKHAPR